MSRKTHLKRGQAFDYLIRNESSFFAPFSFNQSHRKKLIYSDFHHSSGTDPEVRC